LPFFELFQGFFDGIELVFVLYEGVFGEVAPGDSRRWGRRCARLVEAALNDGGKAIVVVAAVVGGTQLIDVAAIHSAGPWRGDVVSLGDEMQVVSCGEVPKLLWNIGGIEREQFS
jgi:uncharacterized protein YjeT (DUF2065 family)